MDLNILHDGVLTTELACVYFLQLSVVHSKEFICVGKGAMVCGNKMKLVSRKQNSGKYSAHWRCSKRNCRLKRSVRSTSAFFSYEDVQGRRKTKLSLCQIVQLLYLWLHTHCATRKLQPLMSLSSDTIIDWLNLFREVCSQSILNLPRLSDTPEVSIQIGESHFSSVSARCEEVLLTIKHSASS